MYSLDDWKRCWQTGHTPWRGELLASDKPLLSLYHAYRSELFGQSSTQPKIQVECGAARSDLTNPALPRCFSVDTTSSPAPRRAFVPLCGDSPAIRYFVDEGFSVTAVDFIEEPLLSLMHGSCRDLLPATLLSVESSAAIRLPLSTERLSLICADIFNLPSSVSQAAYELMYDRAALIALPREARLPYASLIASLIAPGGCLLLEIVDMPGRGEAGPPYSVSRDEVSELFRQFSIVVEEITLPALPPERLRDKGVTEIIYSRLILRR